MQVKVLCSVGGRLVSVGMLETRRVFNISTLFFFLFIVCSCKAEQSIIVASLQSVVVALCVVV